MKKIQLFRVIAIAGLCLCTASCSKAKISNEKSKEIENISTVINEDTTDAIKAAISMKDGLKDDTLITVRDDEASYGLLRVNIKGEKNQVLLCKDPVYNIVYYVNYGNDYYIYRLKDGKSELVVELPARRLFCVEGKLYFILDTYQIYTPEDMEQGNIFCYDPLSGKVTKIIDKQATTMLVYEDGIYYSIETSGKDLGNGMHIVNRVLYFYSFSTGKSESIDKLYTSLYKWKDYYITTDVVEVEEGDELYDIYGQDEMITRAVGVKLETLDMSKSIKLPIEPQSENYSIVGNKIYSILHNDEILIYDIEAMGTEEIQLAFQCTDDFTIFNGLIYISQNMLQINPETGVQSKISSENVDEVIYELYTDGDNLYGVCGSKNDTGHGVLKRIIIEDTPENSKVMEMNGIRYETDRLLIHTQPIGEE